MSETKGAAMSETAVERRLREMATDERQHSRALSEIECPQADAIDAGREALALLRRYKSGELNWLAFDGLVRALLARCEGETR